MPSTPGVRTDPAPREQLVAEIRDRLARLGAPRLQLLLILLLAGIAAFLASVAGLWLGVASMTVHHDVLPDHETRSTRAPSGPAAPTRCAGNEGTRPSISRADWRRTAGRQV